VLATHTVRAGETLAAIAHRYGTTWQAIARLNAVANPNRLVIGQRLMLPPHAVRAQPSAPKPTTGRSSATSPATKPGGTPSSAPAASAQPGAAGAAGGITDAQLRAIMPHAGDRAATFLGPINTATRAYGIDTNERRAAFLAQISVESGDLRNTEENLNYSAERLHQVWPRRFPTLASAQPYAHNPEALGNHVYANRLGNGDEASGDGYRFRGRGLMQTTGRSNYRAAGFENSPDDLANPSTAADSAARFWSTNGLNPRSATVLARGAFNGITLTVNGGTNGSDERWAAYGRAIPALGLTPHP
jgi:putative chitinase